MTQKTNDAPFLTPRELAGRWKVSDASILRSIHAGKLPALRVPGVRAYRIRTSDVEQIERSGNYPDRIPFELPAKKPARRPLLEAARDRIRRQRT